MEKHLKRIYLLDIITILLLGLYVVYLIRVIFEHYHGTDIKVTAAFVIPIFGALIVNLFFRTILSIKRGLYDRGKQKVGAILFITFMCASDILIYTAFVYFHPLGKIVFILANSLAILHARRYAARLFIKHNPEIS